MTGEVPKDVIERYAVGSAEVSTYQTSGMDDSVKGGAPTRGQGDAYAVVTSRTALDETSLSRVLDDMAEKGGKVATANVGSVGAVASISQVQPAVAGGSSFDVAVGTRGDCQIMIAKIDANGTVSLIATEAKLKPGDAPWNGTEFAERGGNFMATERVDLKPGEKAVVFAMSDGVTDPFRPREGGLVKAMESDIQAYLKSNPDGDVSRFLSERATQLGSADNTTVVSARLGANTDLKGQSITFGVFDGTGHTDNTVSSVLARSLETDVPGAQKPQLVARQELDHVLTRTQDLERVARPDAPDPNTRVATQTVTEKLPGPVKTVVKPDVPKVDTPKTETPKPPTSKFAGALTNKPEVKPEVKPVTPGGAKSNISTKAGVAQGLGQAAIDVAKGDYANATVNAAAPVLLNQSTYTATATVAV
jgi:hypothetical protein